MQNCDCKIDSLFGVVWQQNWLLAGRGVAAELAVWHQK